MKAAYYTRYGSSDEITIREIPVPQPKDNEVLINVRACTVNRTDCGWLHGTPWVARIMSGIPTPKNKILGTEFAGEIVAVGSAVSKFKVGDVVFGFSEFKFGAQAEFMVMPEDGMLATVPRGFTFAEAAAMVEGAYYAQNYIKELNAGPGTTVLLNGACGGIGSAALQLLVAMGAEVTAVCTTQTVDLMMKLGAKEVIDYTKEDFTQFDNKYDVVFDAVGKSSFGKCKKLLKPRGIYTSSELGYMCQNLFYAVVTPLLGGKKLSFPLPKLTMNTILYLRELAEKGSYKPVIDREYLLDQIGDAYRYVESGQKVGNVVITIN